MRKVKDDYRHMPEPRAEHVQDIVRAECTFTHPYAMAAWVELLSREFTIIRVKPKLFTAPSAERQHCILVNVWLPEGMPGEVQLLFEEHARLKRVSHKFYKITRERDPVRLVDPIFTDSNLIVSALRSRDRDGAASELCLVEHRLCQVKGSMRHFV
eukprot:CAMPEP_0204348706 /NCGR_PEP_ID=MMETSP0469-20131031/28931_1 /ASSEMBLY_ACC=CAM_ASM_000384 /TAXON_ID=2969 /ORGANISM="Oxyrrhis marina" /LENGTH=155 /DNA_ID=CAMNT_0051334727 /DNA_START=116 /DNA_END=580 /DNA_ORIENTATION=+